MVQRGLARIAGLAFAFAASLSLALVLVPGRADAGISSCSVSSTGIVFSPYDTQTKAAVDGTGTITVTCSGDGNNNGLTLNITGGNANACSPRHMSRGTATLSYNVFREAARTSTWCDGGSRLDFNVDFTSGASQTLTFTMFGRVVAAQNPVYSTSPYTDSLTISVKRGGGTLATTSATISSMVAAICSVSAGTLGFGGYSGTAVNATAAVSVSCSNGAPYQVGLSGGSHQSGSVRRMAGPLSSFLSYQLYSDSLRTVPWGDGSAQLGARRGGTGSGAAQSLTVWGRIPAGQNPAVGSYSDSVVVTVEY
jgi:spore coat protein U-like protein